MSFLQPQESNNQEQTPEPQHNIFLMIPAFIANDPEIDDSTAMLFGRICALSNQFGYCTVSEINLADITRSKEREVRNRIFKLEKHGYVKRTKEFIQISHLYLREGV